MPGYQNYGYYPDPEDERREREMDLMNDPEALAGIAGARPPVMDLTQDPEALQGSPDWQRFNQSRAEMRDELDNPPPMMDLTQDPEALNSPMLQQQMAQRPPPPPAAGMRSQGSLASLLPQRDAEMDSRWRTAEQNALSRSGYGGNQSYGVGEAVRDFAPMAIGGALDIFLNKGRGLGALAGAGMQANAQTAANRQKEAGAAGDFALAARTRREQVGNPELDAAYKQAQIANWQQQRDQGWANLNQRDVRQQALDTQRRLESDPNDPQALAMAQQIYQQTGGTIDVRGQLGAKNQGRVAPMARNVQELYLAEPKAAATAQGRITTELQNEPATTSAAARQAAAVKGASVVAGTEAERTMGATTPVANATVANEGVWGALTDAQRSKGLAAAEARAVFDHALTTMTEIADRNGSQNLPSKDKAAYDAAHGAALGQLSNLYHTGVINELEYQRMAERLPKSGGLKATATDVYGRVSGQPKLLGDVARGSGGETLSELETIMAQYGLGAPSRAQPSAAGAPNPVTNGLVNPSSPLQLTDTGGRRDVPKLPSDVYRAGNGRQQAAGKAPMSGGTVNDVPMATPNGDGSFDIDGETYTADEVQKLKTKGLIR